VQPVFESIESLSPSEFVRWVAAREEVGDGYRYELLNGRIVMTPSAGWPHGSIEAKVVAKLTLAGEGAGCQVFGLRIPT